MIRIKNGLQFFLKKKTKVNWSNASNTQFYIQEQFLILKILSKNQVIVTKVAKLFFESNFINQLLQI